MIDTTFIGGDFGGKGLSIDEYTCYFLARATGRPIKSVMSYADELQASNSRHSAIMTLRKHGIDYSSLVQNPTFDPNGRFQIEGLRSPLDWYLRDGVLRDQIDLSQVVNFDYVDRAAQRLGPYQ